MSAVTQGSSPKSLATPHLGHSGVCAFTAARAGFLTMAARHRDKAQIMQWFSSRNDNKVHDICTERCSGPCTVQPTLRNPNSEPRYPSIYLNHFGIQDLSWKFGGFEFWISRHTRHCTLEMFGEQLEWLQVPPADGEAFCFAAPPGTVLAAFSRKAMHGKVDPAINT